MKITFASMAIIDEGKAVILPINSEWFSGHVLAVDVLRLDEIHPVVSGNKWYKLKQNLTAAKDSGFNSILSFGGAFSNHLIATAFAANEFGLRSTGMVRGLHAQEKLTPTLLACRQYGMELRFLTRAEYSKKEEEAWLNELHTEYPNSFIIPEGGANEHGRVGAGEIAKFITADYTHICCSVGTATTFTGLRNALPAHQAMTGFAPMKGGQYLSAAIEKHLHKGCGKWMLTDAYHFGGFGKWNDELIRFMNVFYRQNSLPLDIVYTAKMMYGLQQLLREKYFPTDAKILCIHTGGLQGNSMAQAALAQQGWNTGIIAK